jgi:hypothetical protein
MVSRKKTRYTKIFLPQICDIFATRSLLTLTAAYILQIESSVTLYCLCYCMLDSIAAAAMLNSLHLANLLLLLVQKLNRRDLDAKERKRGRERETDS